MWRCFLSLVTDYSWAHGRSSTIRFASYCQREFSKSFSWKPADPAITAQHRSKIDSNSDPGSLVGPPVASPSFFTRILTLACWRSDNHIFDTIWRKTRTFVPQLPRCDLIYQSTFALLPCIYPRDLSCTASLPSPLTGSLAFVSL